MTYDVILRKEKNAYTARIREWPEIIVQRPSRDEALEQITRQLSEYLTRQVEIVQIDIPLPDSSHNPWLQQFGAFRDDPTFDDLQTEIAAYRKDIDHQTEANTR